MSDYPELVSASGDIQADTKLFRLGSFKVWVELGEGGQKVAVHDLQLNFGLAGIPSASILIGVGTPFGAGADEFEQLRPSLDTVKRGSRAKLKIQVLEQTYGDSDHLSPMLPSGTYLLFDGIIGGVNIQTAEDSRDIGLSINLTHRTGLTLASNTSAFGIFPPGSLDLKSAAGIFFADGDSNPGADGGEANIWDSWIVENIRRVLTPNEESINATHSALLDMFDDYKNAQLSNFEQAIANTTGELALRSEQDISESSRHDICQHIVKYIVRGAKATNALHLVTQLGEDMYFSLMGLANKLYVFPYWPYRKVSQMLALKAGSFVVTNHKSTTLMSRGALVGGTLVSAPPSSWYVASMPESNGPDAPSTTYRGAYEWEGFTEDEKRFMTVDVVRAPTWLLNSYQPSPADQGLDKEAYTKVKPAHSPSGVEKKNKVKPGKEALVGSLDRFARFITLEGLMKGDRVDIYTPLRFDIVPGKVLRLDQTTLENRRTTAESEALYGHVQSVMLRINAVSKTAGIQATISHAHNYDDQRLIEEDEDGPFAYGTGYYQALNDLQLVEREEG